MARRKEAEEQDEDLGNILDRSWDDMPEEQLLPEGTYTLSIRNIAWMPPREEGQNGKVVVFFIPKEPLDDVDEDAIAALGDGYDITENEVTFTQWIERNRDWQPIRDLLGAIGVELEGKSMKDSFKEARRKDVNAYVTQRSYNRADGTTVHQNVATQFSAA